MAHPRHSQDGEGLMHLPPPGNPATAAHITFTVSLLPPTQASLAAWIAATSSTESERPRRFSWCAMNLEGFMFARVPYRLSLFTLSTAWAIQALTIAKSSLSASAIASSSRILRSSTVSSGLTGMEVDSR